MALLSAFGKYQSAFASSQDSAAVMFKKARAASMAQKWEEAYQLFDQILEICPECKYAPASHFWKAWCLSKGEHTRVEAFDQYTALTTRYPSSNYVDDARLQQITLAEGLMQQGEKNYLTFLFQQYHANNQELKQQATFSLARLGYKEVLPTLQEFIKNDKLSLTAEQLIESLEHDQSPSSFHEFALEIHETKDGSNHFQIQYIIPTARLDLERKGNIYEISFDEEVVIYDLDMKEIYKHKNLKTLKQNTRYLFDKTIQGNVKVQLQTGEYILYLAIRNIKSQAKFISLEQINILTDVQK